MFNDQHTSFNEIKSLHPFYTQDIIHFENKFIGDWEDTEHARW